MILEFKLKTIKLNKKNMKKSTMIIALVLGVSSAFAQDLTSKKGEPILPEAGDWALGIDASPFLRYAGGFLSNAGATAPTFDFLSDGAAIIGKKFIDEKTAYRVGLRIGFGSTTQKTKVAAIPATTPATYVDDAVKTSQTRIALTAGKEWRRGKTRLQGLYGAELGFSIGTDKTTNTYGNAISATNPVASRTTETKMGTSFGIGVRGFIGAEYFLFPKISIAGEFGWGLAFTSTGEGSSTTEGWNGTAVESTTTNTGGSSSFGIDTDHLNSIFGTSGTIRLNLHF